MWLSKYVCLFMIYNFMGWIYETLFCIVKGGKWENRGFLYGPICPIYGTGAVAISAIMELTIGKGISLSPWQVFTISVTGSAVLEYFTSCALEKTFHAVWWDYSEFPFNYQGRISLFTSLGFGLGGLFTVYIIAPTTVGAVDYLSPIVLEALALLVLFIFAVDLTLTVTALLHFDRMVARMEDSFNHRMEAIVDNTFTQSNKIKESMLRQGRFVSGQVSTLSGFMKSTVRRISSFKDISKPRETAKNILLFKIRKDDKHKSKAEEQG